MPDGAADERMREETADRALRNTTVRALADLIGKLCTFMLFAALGRAVGESGFGTFIFALALLEVLLVPVALGADSYMLRRVAVEREAIHGLFFNILVLKLVLALPVIAGGLAVAALIGQGGLTLATIAVLAPGLVLETVAKTFHAAFNAAERGELLAVGLVVQRIATAAAAVAVLLAGAGVVSVAAVYSAGAALQVGIATVLMHRRLGLPRPAVARRDWRRLALQTWPFAVRDVFTVLLFKLDIVILSALAADAAVGRYGAAYRLLDSTLFVSWALAGAFGAMYAYLQTDGEPSIGAVFQRSIKLALVVLVPGAVIFGGLAEPVLELVFGDAFGDAATALALLSPVVVLLSVITLSTVLVTSRRDPATIIPLSAAMVALNVALNLALIPPYAEDGAAAAMLVTEVVFVVAVLRMAADAVGGLGWASMLVAPLGAGALMLATVLALRGSFVAALIAGLAVYIPALLLIERLVAPADLRFAALMLRRRLLPRAGPSA
jgi:O-antigen/teichoic acid export membrane protein